MKTTSFSVLMAVVETKSSIQQRNIASVQHIYDCFGRGDVPGILDHLSDGIEWWHAGDPSVVKYAGAFQGKDGVVQFFQILGANVQFTGFEISNYRANGNEVICDGNVSGIATPTGKAYNVFPVFTWTFDEQGKVCILRVDGDMSAADAAFGK